MSVAPRRYSLNQNKISWGILKAPSGSNNGFGNNSSQNSIDSYGNFKVPGHRAATKEVKSEKRISIKLNLDNGPIQIKPRRNFMSLQSDELEDRNIMGARKTLAMKLQQNFINIVIVVLILTYSVLTFAFTAANKDLNHVVIKPIYHSIELIFIIAFVAEVIIFKYAFKELYFLNKFNVANAVVVGLIILFWIMDIAINNYAISILLRMRGVMRLFHVPIIFENMKSYIRLQKGLSVLETKLADNEKSNAERVIETLLQLSE